LKARRSASLPFKPRARMLLLLGDQLIRDAGIAVFELVKNAYDADASRASVTMKNITDQKDGTIIISDDGTGMDWETVTGVWLEPGTDYRSLQRKILERTRRFKRLPLGEKGVGRFAAHKLGNTVTLVSRKASNPEIVVKIDWGQFEKKRYLEDVKISVKERQPRRFKGRKTGTYIRISKLHDKWTRGMVRDLHRAITSICSPFEADEEFKAEIILTENSEWLHGLLDVNEVLEFALFRAQCDIQDSRLRYDYEFRPLPAMDRVEPRQEKKSVNLKIDSYADPSLVERQIGPVHIDLYIFDRDPKILALGVSDKKGLKDFLDEAGGIRVYRDGIRVYDYGEQGNDWLNLGGRRINIPARRISNNLVIGAVSLRADLSHGLVEKTNREGFVDNEAFRTFRSSVSAAIGHIEAERNRDKIRIRSLYSTARIKEPVLEDLTQLRELVEKRNLTKELGSYIDRIEEDFVVIRDRFLTSASAGLSLSVVIHEVEKGIAELVRAVKEDRASPRIKKLAKHLADLVEGFAALVRRTGRSREKASKLIARALFNTELRLQVHKIKAEVNTGQGDFEVLCSRRLTISTLMNLIDNSIWWLDSKWALSENRKRIYLGTSTEFSYGPAIIVADNGPGFLDPPEYLIEPFISRKPDGMGLGLHIADQVMKVQGGRLDFPEAGDVSLPRGFKGAVVALVFGGEKK